MATVDPRHVIQRQGRDYVLVIGLIDAAHREGLRSIETTILQTASEANGWRAVAQATVKFECSRIFTASGDAAPDTTDLQCYERLAETRAVGRALRWALNVAELAFEEMPPEARQGGERGQPAADAVCADCGQRLTPNQRVRSQHFAQQDLCPRHLEPFTAAGNGR